VCQIHTAIAALIPSWWLSQSPSRKQLERTAAEIRRAQKRKAAARRSHTKKARRVLRQLGINLTELPLCEWGEDLAL
jgi:hypothetical protein